MKFHLLPLALLPLATMASPIMERWHMDKAMICFHKGQDQIYTDNTAVTQSICTTLSSGIFHKELNKLQACVVADYDVEWFKQRCEGRNSKGDRSEWRAGTGVDVVWEPKEPYDLYCFDYPKNYSFFPDVPFIDSVATSEVCKSLKNGKYHKDKFCRVAKEDVNRFKKRCNNYVPVGYPPDSGTWLPGTATIPIIE